MKHLLLAAAGLATALGLAVLLRPDVGNAQNPETISVPVTQPIGGKPLEASGGVAPFLRPGNQQVPPASYLPTTPGYQQLPGQAPGSGGKDNVYIGNSDRPRSLREYLSQSLDKVAINNDMAVSPECGPWMVCVNWYSGPEAPQMAHDLCLELRNNPDYKLPAYVFTKGLEERQKELQRIAEYVQRERDRLAKAGLPPDTPLRVPLTRYDIECAVLVGGYKDMDTARQALDYIKQLKKPDPNKVKMHGQMVVEPDKKTNEPKANFVLVNPFLFSMVVHNPKIPVQHSTEQDEEDRRLTRVLNDDESYSLLKCPKRYTLAVKQFSLPVMYQPKKSTGGLLDSLFGGSSDKVDEAKINAHNLADLLRKAKFEAYALHMKHCSFVCVGSYDSQDDPRLKLDQERLPQQLNPQLDQAIQLLAHPVVMEVPR